MSTLFSLGRLLTHPQNPPFLEGQFASLVDATGNDGNASMPEQVKRPNPWRKMMLMMMMMMMMMYHTAARSFVCETTPRALHTQTKLPGKKGVRTKNAELHTAEYSIVGHCYMYLYTPLTLQNPRFQK